MCISHHYAAMPPNAYQVVPDDVGLLQEQSHVIGQHISVAKMRRLQARGSCETYKSIVW